MPAKAPATPPKVTDTLLQLGGQIRAHRKALRINATAAAEAAGISRVTLHRIEKGGPAVTIGAYLNVMTALGMRLGVLPPDTATDPGDRLAGWIPARVRLADYPQLKQLAWQVQGVDTLTPVEALSIYERNARHLDAATLTPQERHLIAALRLALGGGDTGGRKDV